MEDEKKELGLDLSGAAVISEVDGKQVVTFIGNGMESFKNGLINNTGTLVFGLNPTDLENEKRGQAPRLDRGWGSGKRSLCRVAGRRLCQDSAGRKWHYSRALLAGHRDSL